MLFVFPAPYHHVCINFQWSLLYNLYMLFVFPAPYHHVCINFQWSLLYNLYMLFVFPAPYHHVCINFQWSLLYNLYMLFVFPAPYHHTCINFQWSLLYNLYMLFVFPAPYHHVCINFQWSLLLQLESSGKRGIVRFLGNAAPFCAVPELSGQQRCAWDPERLGWKGNCQQDSPLRCEYEQRSQLQFARFFVALTMWSFRALCSRAHHVFARSALALTMFSRALSLFAPCVAEACRNVRALFFLCKSHVRTGLTVDVPSFFFQAPVEKMWQSIPTQYHYHALAGMLVFSFLLLFVAKYASR